MILGEGNALCNLSSTSGTSELDLVLVGGPVLCNVWRVSDDQKMMGMVNVLKKRKMI